MVRQASHEILVITDGDVRVSPDYLRNVVAPFADNMTGAVTSLYRGVVQPNGSGGTREVGRNMAI